MKILGLVMVAAVLVALIATPSLGSEAGAILEDRQAILDIYNAGELLDVKIWPDMPAWVDNPRTRLEAGNPHLVWITDLTLWTESLGTKRVVFYFDKRQMPDGLTDAEQLEFWDILRTASVDQHAFDVNGQKDYSAFWRAYIGEPVLIPTTVTDPETGEETTTWQPENYTIQGRYNSNPGNLDREAVR